MRTLVLRAALVLTSLLLAAGTVATVPAHAGAAPASDPAPSPVWDTALTTTAGGFGFGYIRGSVDVFGGDTYRVDTDYDPDTAETSYVYEVYDSRGVRTFGDAGGAAIDAGLSSVDAGPWGAVVGGSVIGAFPGATSAGGSDGFVRRYAADGTVAWTTQLGSSSYDYVYGVAVLGDRVVAVGDLGGEVLLYSLDLGTGATTGPIFLGEASQGMILSVATLGADVVVSGTTSRKIDSDDTRSSYSWVARLDGADLTDVMWETNGVSDDSSNPTAGRPLTVLGGDVYVATLRGGTQGVLTSFAGVTGDLRWNKVIGLYKAATSLTSYRGNVVVAGVVGTGFGGGSALGYDSLIQGYSPTGAKRWVGHVDEDESDALVYVTGAGASPQAGLVVAGVTGESTSSTSIGRFLSGLRVRAPQAAVRTTGGFSSSAATQVRRGTSTSAQLRITNAGELVDRLALRGCVTPASVTLVVKEGRKNVTSKVRNGSYRTRALAVGKSTTLAVTITAGPKANLRTLSCKLVSSSVADPDNTSTGLLEVAIKR